MCLLYCCLAPVPSCLAPSCTDRLDLGRCGCLWACGAPLSGKAPLCRTPASSSRSAIIVNFIVYVNLSIWSFSIFCVCASSVLRPEHLSLHLYVRTMIRYIPFVSHPPVSTAVSVSSSFLSPSLLCSTPPSNTLSIEHYIINFPSFHPFLLCLLLSHPF